MLGDPGVQLWVGESGGDEAGLWVALQYPLRDGLGDRVRGMCWAWE